MKFMLINLKQFEVFTIYKTLGMCQIKRRITGLFSN